jgi:hypothetical protein
MKKTLLSGVLALAMAIAGAAPAAQAASNTGAFVPNYFSESGTLSGPTMTIGVGVKYLNLWADLVPNASAWASIQNGTRSLVAGGAASKDGSAIVNGVSLRANYSSDVTDASGAWIAGNYGANDVRTFAVPASANPGSARLGVSVNFYSGMMGDGGVPAGTYAFTPSLTIDGVAANLSDYTVTYRYSINHVSSFTAQATATYVNKSGSTCVNTTGYSVGDVLNITVSNNGTAGYTQAGSNTMTSRIGKATTPGTMGGSALATLSASTGIYSHTLTSNDINSLLIVEASYSGQKNSSGAETIDASVTKGGVEVTTACYAASLAAPVVTNVGNNSVVTVTSPAIAGFESLYDIMCYADPTVFGPNSMPFMPRSAVNGTCTFSNTAAATTYNFYYRASLSGGQVYAFGVMSASVQSIGAQGAPAQQVAPQAPAIVFNQPKFEIPAKIAISASGKVSLSGKDMGVTSVVVGGKDQKVDVNSDTKLEFDTTGLTKGVHDLVMKGAFGTYTIQKAIQVGEAVVTKVAAVSARQVAMTGGELSISGQGLEGTTQITMNGQVLEIVSKTDSKVTFKVPASTVASVNSLKIEGAFVPVIFKNAFSYTK